MANREHGSGPKGDTEHLGTPKDMIEQQKQDTNFLSPIGNKKVKAKKDAFLKFMAENKHRDFIVFSHDNPDPDSLASAYGMYRILGFLGVNSIQMYFCGEISHPQNRAMKTVLKIPINVWTKTIENKIINEDDKPKPVFVFVDCISNSQQNMSIPFEPDIAVDHHKTPA